ncbi:MAG: YdcF family protein [Pseudomonadota bacterium]
MFELSKLLGPLVDPRTLVFLALVLGTALLWTRWSRAGRGLVSAAVALAVLFGAVPIGPWLLARLEDRFPAPAASPGGVDGIVALGGDVAAALAVSRGGTSFGAGGAGRLIAFAELARRHPQARLIFSGGAASLLRPDVKEASAAAVVLPLLGLDPARVIFEDRSRNTHENAVMTLALADPKPGETWLLVTSAFHMPRAIGAFRRAGWTIQPWPADYLTEPQLRAAWTLTFDGGFALAAIAVREWAGLVFYRALGRTDALFPGP